MPLKDRLRFLTDLEQVDGFARENAAAAIFKAGSCHKTSEMFANVDSQLGDGDELPVGVTRVVESRSASNRVAEPTGIRHESLQLVLLKEGRPVYDRDNWSIATESIAEALDEHFARVPDGPTEEV
jgi:monothiol bacilliredoxin